MNYSYEYVQKKCEYLLIPRYVHFFNFKTHYGQFYRKIRNILRHALG